MAKSGEGDNSSLVQLDRAGYTYPSSFDAGPALRPTTLDVKVGEAVRITGRNGTGKTTLLKVLAGVLEPTTGTRTPSPGLRAIYLDQKAADFLAESLTVREQLFVGVSPKLGALTSVAKIKLDQTLNGELARYNVGLERKLDAFIAELSGGQRQIVALLCAVSSDAQLLLLDEFKAGMDPVSAVVSDQIVGRAVEAKRISVVFVDHVLGSPLSMVAEIHLD